MTLATGRFAEAGYILRTFSHYVRDGLIPNLFPEGQQAGLYHTADATLWYFHAIDRYVRATDDRQTLRALLPMLRDIVEHHLRGTRFGIGVDPADGLLAQGQEGYQLTWMDAKVGDWVVTPRRGKAVEINALWYNALCLMSAWKQWDGSLFPADAPGAAIDFAAEAERVGRSFNERFWYAAAWLLVRRRRWPRRRRRFAAAQPAVRHLAAPAGASTKSAGRRSSTSCQRQLLTPVGLRSLAPGEPDYKPKYDGDLRARDAAYHQGTVWAWLIGPFIDAWLKTHPQRVDQARGIPDRVLRTLGRGLRRLDQRDFRRRGPLRSARLRGPGLERGRSPPLVAGHQSDGGAEETAKR